MYIDFRACAQSCTSRPRWWLVPCTMYRRWNWFSGSSDSSADTGRKPHSAVLRAMTSIAAACTSRKIAPGRTTANAASAASSTASYTRRCTSEKVPFTGKVRVMSAV